jgi:hypothetical protein
MKNRDKNNEYVKVEPPLIFNAGNGTGQNKYFKPLEKRNKYFNKYKIK